MCVIVHMDEDKLKTKLPNLCVTDYDFTECKLSNWLISRQITDSSKNNASNCSVHLGNVCYGNVSNRFTKTLFILVFKIQKHDKLLFTRSN